MTSLFGPQQINAILQFETPINLIRHWQLKCIQILINSYLLTRPSNKFIFYLFHSPHMEAAELSLIHI